MNQHRSPSGEANLRSERLLQSAAGPEVSIDGRPYLYFGGTGYLGLQSHPDVLAAAINATQRYGMGSATTRAAFGTTPPIREVEREMADWFETEDAFYFPSGYAGASIVLDMLSAERYDMVLLDEASHYSLWDAARATGLAVGYFQHRNADALEICLQDARSHGNHRAIVLTDAVFAATGRIAPLDEYLEVISRYDGVELLIDDAHGLGVLGEQGRGAPEHFGLLSPPWNGMPASTTDHGVACYHTATLSKAIGGYGGILVGSQEFIAAAIRSPDYYRGASPLPSPVAAATAEAIRIVRDSPQLRESLHSNTRHLRNGLRTLGLEVDDDPTPIVSLTIGTAATMQRIQTTMAGQGVIIAYFDRYAGLPQEGALRIAVFANHTTEQIDRLIESLGSIL